MFRWSTLTSPLHELLQEPEAKLICLLQPSIEEVFLQNDVTREPTGTEHIQEWQFAEGKVGVLVPSNYQKADVKCWQALINESVRLTGWGGGCFTLPAQIIHHESDDKPKALAPLTCRTLCGAKPRLSLGLCNRTAGLVLALTSGIRREDSHISHIFLPHMTKSVCRRSVSDICDFRQVLVKWLSTPSLTGRCPPEVISIQSIHFYPSSYGPLVRCQACQAFSLLRPPSCCSLLPLHGHSFHLWWAVTRAREKCRFKKRRMRPQGEGSPHVQRFRLLSLNVYCWMLFAPN